LSAIGFIRIIGGVDNAKIENKEQGKGNNEGNKIPRVKCETHPLLTRSWTLTD